jgi:hypothetical protein
MVRLPITTDHIRCTIVCYTVTSQQAQLMQLYKLFNHTVKSSCIIETIDPTVLDEILQRPVMAELVDPPSYKEFEIVISKLANN